MRSWYARVAMTTLPRACPLCMGRVFFEKAPPGAVEAGSCKDCKAIILILAVYPFPVGAFP